MHTRVRSVVSVSGLSGQQAVFWHLCPLKIPASSWEAQCGQSSEGLREVAYNVPWVWSFCLWHLG